MGATFALRAYSLAALRRFRNTRSHECHLLLIYCSLVEMGYASLAQLLTLSYLLHDTPKGKGCYELDGLDVASILLDIFPFESPTNEFSVENGCASILIRSMPHYVALSHTWNHDSPLRKILVNGVGVDVGSNLELPLNTLMRNPILDDNCKIQVDALCIDQSNE